MPTVQKWGNSLGIRVPKSIAEQVDLRDGSEFEFDTSGGVLKVRPKRRVRRRKYTLASLLAKVKGPSPHRHLDRDRPVGRELL
jgi:antitoxin MazE